MHRGAIYQFSVWWIYYRRLKELNGSKSGNLGLKITFINIHLWFLYVCVFAHWNLFELIPYIHTYVFSSQLKTSRVDSLFLPFSGQIDLLPFSSSKHSKTITVQQKRPWKMWKASLFWPIKEKLSKSTNHFIPVSICARLKNPALWSVIRSTFLAFMLTAC